MTRGADIRGAAVATRAARPLDQVETPQEPDVTEAAPAVDPAPEPMAPPPLAPKREPAKGGGMIPLIFGGVIAAALGFAAAFLGMTGQEDTELPSRVTGVEQALDEIGTRLNGFETTLSGLSDEIAARASETPAAVTDLAGQVETLAGDLAGLTSSVEGIEGTITNLSLGGGGEGAPDFAAAFDAQMESFRAEVARVTSSAEAEVAAARAETDAMRAAAEAEAAAAREAAETAEAQVALRAALAEIQVALDTGAPFASALDALSGLDVPEGLTAVAADGVLPLTELQRTFPDAARGALRASDRGPDETANAVDKVTSFLLAQTNARSLEPREGDSADAVLSRSEAALKSGDLTSALAEVQGLGEGPLAAMSAWLTGAQARDAAVSAVADLSQTVDAM